MARAAETGPLLPLCGAASGLEESEAEAPAPCAAARALRRRRSLALGGAAAAAAAAAALAAGAARGGRGRPRLTPRAGTVHLQVEMLECSAPGAACNSTRCCSDPLLTCFAKNEFWASCMPTCEPGVHAEDPPEEGDQAWSCEVLSQARGAAVAATGAGEVPPAAGSAAAAAGAAPAESARLFCWALVQTSGDEHDLVEEQRKRGLSIFDCEEHLVIPGSAKSSHGGSGEDATGSWTNVEVFIDAWRQVETDGRYLRHDWTVKADPDAVFVPARLREHLVARAWPASGAYINNCGSYKYGFFGALEVISTPGVSAYLSNIARCQGEFQWSGWGEDLFAQRCMDLVGVSGVDDFELVTDGNCGEAPAPCSTGRAAYHPYKIMAQWLSCYDEIVGAMPGKQNETTEEQEGEEAEPLVAKEGVPAGERPAGANSTPPAPAAGAKSEERQELTVEEQLAKEQALRQQEERAAQEQRERDAEREAEEKRAREAEREAQEQRDREQKEALPPPGKPAPATEPPARAATPPQASPPASPAAATPPQAPPTAPPAAAAPPPAPPAPPAAAAPPPAPPAAAAPPQHAG